MPLRAESRAVHRVVGDVGEAAVRREGRLDRRPPLGAGVAGVAEAREPHGVGDRPPQPQAAGVVDRRRCAGTSCSGRGPGRSRRRRPTWGRSARRTWPSATAARGRSAAPAAAWRAGRPRWSPTCPGLRTAPHHAPARSRPRPGARPPRGRRRRGRSGGTAAQARSRPSAGRARAPARARPGSRRPYRAERGRSARVRGAASAGGLSAASSGSGPACTGPRPARRCSRPAPRRASSACTPSASRWSRATFSSRCFGQHVDLASRSRRSS